VDVDVGGHQARRHDIDCARWDAGDGSEEA